MARGIAGRLSIRTGVALVAALALAAGGCGGGDGGIEAIDFVFAEPDTLAAPELLATADDAAWFAVDEGVVAVDAATREVRGPVQVPGVEALAAADGAAWAALNDATVRRIDLIGRIGDPVRIAPAPEFSVDSPVTGAMAVGPTAVWVALRDRVARVDRAGGEVLPAVPVDGVADLVADGAVVWAGGAGRLLRIEEATGEVTGEVRVGDEGGDVAARDGRVWLRSGDVLREVDPATMTPFPEPIPLGDEPPSSLDAGPDALWGVLRERNQVVRIDRDTGEVTDRFTLDSPYSSQSAELSSVRVGAGGTWVGTQIGNRAGVVEPS